MFNSVVQMEKILKEELACYQKILLIENSKSDVIVDRNGLQLEKLAMEQDELLIRIDHLEDLRQEYIKQYIEENNLRDIKEGISLKEIVSSMDEDSSSHIMALAIELKSIILSLKKTKETNEKLIQDNLEFFNLLLAGLKKETTVNSGYSESGIENNKISQSILFNKTV